MKVVKLKRKEERDFVYVDECDPKKIYVLKMKNRKSNCVTYYKAQGVAYYRAQSVVYEWKFVELNGSERCWNESKTLFLLLEEAFVDFFNNIHQKLPCSVDFVGIYEFDNLGEFADWLDEEYLKICWKCDFEFKNPVRTDTEICLCHRTGS
jgi:hypothetical protein